MIKKIVSCIFLVFIFFCFSGCYSTKKLVGNWETVELLKNDSSIEVIESDIKIRNKDDKLIVKGCAGVNLYACQIEIKGKKFSAFEMENTGFMGPVSDMEYEDLFFRVLMTADSYKIENDILYLFSSSENMEIRLKKVDGTGN